MTFRLPDPAAAAALDDEAAALDAADPLAEYVSAFVADADVVSYLDGNSLGRPTAAFADRVSRFVTEEWGGRLIRGWDEAWMAEPYRLGDRIGRVALGADEGQTVVGDSTTVLLYKTLRAAVAARPGRGEIVVDDDNFPTDRFIAEGVAAETGLRIRWIHADPASGVTPEQVADAVGEDTAAVLLSHAAYRSGYVLDVPAVVGAVQDAGALLVLDLCHSAGVVPTLLDDWGVDLAVGCTYKYLNGGPGSPAFCYVARRHQGTLRQPIQGWMGAADVFAMGPQYRPAEGIGSFVSGTPPILGMLAISSMLDLIEAAGIEAVAEKSRRLTDFAERALQVHVLPRGAELISPAAGPRRGSHLTVSHPSFEQVTARLWERGVIPDFRAPDGIRLGLSPLSTSFAEVEVGVRALGEETAAASGPTGRSAGAGSSEGR
ncbi:MAG: aminotransferase class V-fold PLP-dependent enzyme [Nesterenkonia sp.]|nr:aminotransferase class V-fold PLP-dependent enzyme [Nesterenkonia sp.]